MNGQSSQPEPDLNPPSDNKTPLQRLESHFGRRILAGFFVLIPLLVTVLLLRFAFFYVDDIFRGDDGFFIKLIEDTVFDFPGVGVIFAIVMLYIVGLIVAGRAGRRAIDWQSAILSRIPVVKTIYGVTKQATDALTSPSGHRFSRVVFLDWPRPGVKALGFVTGHCHAPFDPEQTLMVIYIPTVPNPTSGNLAFVTEEQIVETGLTVEDAMKIVFSGGIVLPDTLAVGPTVALTDLPDGTDGPITFPAPPTNVDKPQPDANDD